MINSENVNSIFCVIEHSAIACMVIHADTPVKKNGPNPHKNGLTFSGSLISKEPVMTSARTHFGLTLLPSDYQLPL